MGTVILFGEIMLRLKPPLNERFLQARSFEAVYGGGEANAAVSLAHFGHYARYVTRLPNNELGEACLASLRQYGVDTTYIQRGGERLGIYFLEAGAAQRPSKVVYDRAGSSFATLQPGMLDWQSVFTGAAWFHWSGITPAVSESAAQVCMEGIQTAKQAGLTISCDLNYRAKLWKWTNSPGKVMADLVSLCDVALGNEEDAEKVFGIKAQKSQISAGIIDPADYQAICDQLARLLPNLKTIAITLRGSLSASHNTWSAVLWQNGRFFKSPVYDILPVMDRVGSGDAFAAGLIHALLTKPDDPEYALQFATAAGCLKHSIPGDFNLVSLAEVETLMAGDASGRVIR